MADLGPQIIDASYQGLIQVPGDVAAGAVTAQTGNGTSLPFSVSDTSLKILDTLDLTGATVTGLGLSTADTGIGVIDDGVISQNWTTPKFLAEQTSLQTFQTVLVEFAPINLPLTLGDANVTLELSELSGGTQASGAPYLLVAEVQVGMVSNYVAMRALTPSLGDIGKVLTVVDDGLGNPTLAFV